MMQVDEYQSILMALRDNLGIVVVDDTLAELATTLKPVMAEFSIPNLENLSEKINEGNASQLVSGVVHAITTHDTTWMGYPGISSILKENILQDVMNNHISDYRIWIIGCGHGQIAYSVAMLIEDFKDTYGLTSNIEILATDVSASMVSQASEGVFDDVMLTGLTPIYKEKYMDSDGGQWVVNSKIRSMVNFVAHDLLDTNESFGNFDLIICPEVLVYYETEIKSSILDGFISNLSQNGKLIVGVNEPVVTFCNKFIPIEHESGVIYGVREN